MKNKSLILLFISIISAFYTTQAAKRIKALCITGTNERWDGLFSMRPLLKKHGLIFIKEKNDADVILCNKVNSNILAQNKPIIILEKSAGASVTKSTKNYLHLPQVKAVFKDRILRNKQLNNVPAIRGKYFYNLINDYAHLVKFDENTSYKRNTPIPQLTEYELNKIKLVIWDIWGGPFNQQKFPELTTYEIEYTSPRNIDVFFAGKSKGNDFYKWHRTKALTTIGTMHGIETLALDGKVLPFDEYIETIKASKIVVSPWGLGEWCFRDFEAIHCGALLIKPDTSFVESFPDIYKNYKTYIPCKPDFSDLEAIVHHILAHYNEYDHIRRRAKKLVTKTWGMEQLAKIFVESISAALDEEVV